MNTNRTSVYLFWLVAALAVGLTLWWGYQQDEAPAPPPKLTTAPAPPISAGLEAELEALRADLDIYEREGLTPTGRAALEKVVTFADQHPEVNVVFYEEAVPWVIHGPSDAPTPDFMAAFVAGNIRALLATGQRRTNSYAGTLEVLRVYQWHKERDPGLKVPSLEAFELLDRKGKLRERLDKVDKKEEKRAAEKAAQG